MYSFGSGNVIFIELRHCQFPVCLAFVMTINKAQGQSIYYVGIDLCVPVFSHGQLYVAFSYHTSSDRIKVVYTEVLSGMLNH